MSCARVAPALFAHVNLLLALYAGAGLATAARLKWDPSTYIALREVFPAEYRAAGGVLCALAAALLALGHLAAAALLVRRAAARRALLIMYAFVMAVLVCVEVAWCAWTTWRIRAWLESPQAKQMMEMMEIREHLQPILEFFGRWHPLPEKVKKLIAEAEEDAPRNVYVGGAAAALAAVLQPAALVLALLCAATPAPTAPTAPTATTAAGDTEARNADDSDSWTSTDNDTTPLRTAFKNGRLVVVTPAPSPRLPHRHPPPPPPSPLSPPRYALAAPAAP